MSQRPEKLQRVFVLWVTNGEADGLRASLNSIYAWHRQELRVLVIDAGMPPEERRAAERLLPHTEWNNVSIGEGSGPESGVNAPALGLPWLIERAHCVCLLAVGAVLTSGHSDLFKLAEHGRIQGSPQGLLCLDLSRHGKLLVSVLATLDNQAGCPEVWWRALTGALAEHLCYEALPEPEWGCGPYKLVESKVAPESRPKEVWTLGGETICRFAGNSGLPWWKIASSAAGASSVPNFEVFEYYRELLPAWHTGGSDRFPIFLLTCEQPNPRTATAVKEVWNHFGRAPHVVTGPSKHRRTLAQRCLPLAPEARLSAGEWACATGHAEMLTRFLASGAPWALFLEDDVNFLAPAARFEECGTLLETEAPGWGWLICGRNDVWFSEPPPESFPEDHDCHWQCSGVMRVRSGTYGAYCNLVSRTGAVHLLNCLIPLRAPIDLSTKRPRGAAAYQVCEALACTHHGVPSLINS